MTQYVGGKRARLNHMAVFEVVRDGLDELNWLDEDAGHELVTVISKQVDRDDTIKPNVVVVVAEDVTQMDMEMGTNLAEQRWDYYIDVYAEDDAVGMHLATDIKDILNGRFTSSVSRLGPNITVYDRSVSSATPIELHHIEIEDLNMDRSRFYEKPHEKHWWMLAFAVVDQYGSEDY